MHKLAVLLFPLLFLAGCNAFAFVGEPRYISLGILQNNNVWVYNYTSFLTHGVDSEAQNVTFSAKLEVTCESCECAPFFYALYSGFPTACGTAAMLQKYHDVLSFCHLKIQMESMPIKKLRNTVFT
jgi:hypothetical protein